MNRRSFLKACVSAAAAMVMPAASVLGVPKIAAMKVASLVYDDVFLAGWTWEVGQVVEIKPAWKEVTLTVKTLKNNWIVTESSSIFKGFSP